MFLISEEGEFYFVRRHFSERRSKQKKPPSKNLTFACRSPYFQTATAPRGKVRARGEAGGFERSRLGCGRTRVRCFLPFLLSSERECRLQKNVRDRRRPRRTLHRRPLLLFQLSLLRERGLSRFSSPSSHFSLLSLSFSLSLSLPGARPPLSSFFCIVLSRERRETERRTQRNERVVKNTLASRRFSRREGNKNG